MDKELQQRLSDTADRAEIENLLGLYCRAIDRLDLELLRSVYHPDAVDDHGAMCLNAHEFSEKIIELLGNLCVNTMHTVTHSVIELDGDDATSESYYLAVHVIAANAQSIENWFGPTYLKEQKVSGCVDKPHEYICCGRYLDCLEKRKGVWKISKRQITNEWGVCRPVQMVTEGFPASSSVMGNRDRSDPVYAAGLR